MSFIYQKLRDRDRTYIKEKVKSRDKYTCSEFPNDPVEKTGCYLVIIRIVDYFLAFTLLVLHI